MNAELTEILTKMKASYPYYNPNNTGNLEHKETVPKVLTESRKEENIIFKFKENGSKIIRADLIYTLNGGDKYEEWFRTRAEIKDDTTITAVLPKNTTHYLLNLIDENNFLVSYPEMPASKKIKKEQYSKYALKK